MSSDEVLRLVRIDLTACSCHYIRPPTARENTIQAPTCLRLKKSASGLGDVLVASSRMCVVSVEAQTASYIYRIRPRFSLTSMNGSCGDSLAIKC